MFSILSSYKVSTELTKPKCRSDRTPIIAWQPSRRESFNSKEFRTSHPDIIEEEFWLDLEDVWDFSALSVKGLYNLWSACRHIAQRRVRGDIVECGVFFGGSIMIAAHAFRRFENGNRRIVAIDTFHGFLRRCEDDIDFNGEEVCHPSDLQKEWSFLEFAENNIRSVEYDHSRLEIVEGDVFDVLEPVTRLRKIAILRLDTDTYDTTRKELEICWPRIVHGGVLIVDDYGWCKGARKAVDEFFVHKPVMLHRIDEWVRSVTKI